MTEDETFKRLIRPSVQEMDAIIASYGHNLLDFDKTDIELLLIANNWNPDEFYTKYSQWVWKHPNRL